jgi:hypothetical protein
VDGDEDAGWSDLPVAASFFSPALATGGSLPEDGFILSE